MSVWGSRVCAGCGSDLERGYFSRSQFRKGMGHSRCSLCVAEGVTKDASGFGTARANNNPTRVMINEDAFATGTFMIVAMGTYRGGQRTGQRWGLMVQCRMDPVRGQLLPFHPRYRRQGDGFDTVLEPGGVINSKIRKRTAALDLWTHGLSPSQAIPRRAVY